MYTAPSICRTLYRGLSQHLQLHHGYSYLVFPFQRYPPLSSQMWMYQTSSISPLLEFRIILKNELPSCLWNLDESLKASLKERVSLYGNKTWTNEFVVLAMGEEGRDGERVTSGCGLRWFCRHISTWDEIERTSFSPHLSLPIIHLRLPCQSCSLIGTVIQLHQAAHWRTDGNK